MCLLASAIYKFGDFRSVLIYLSSKAIGPTARKSAIVNPKALEINDFRAEGLRRTKRQRQKKIKRKKNRTIPLDKPPPPEKSKATDKLHVAYLDKLPG